MDTTDVYHKITGIDPMSSSSTTFSDKICFSCFEDLTGAFKFLQRCQSTQRKFSDILENHLQQLENLPEVEHLETDGEENIQTAEVLIILDHNFVEEQEPPLEKSSESKKISCELCGKSFSDEKGLKKHRVQVHALRKKSCGIKKTSLDCTFCRKIFKTKQKLQNHIVTHTGEKNFNCSKCEKAFSLASSLRNHMRIHTGERPYKCPECDMTFAQRNVLVSHQRVHTGEKPFRCSVCDKTFRQYPTLKTHMAIHTGKPVECEECKKTFSRISFLRVHQRKHTGEKPYACDRCPNKYQQKCHLDQHLETHFGVKHQCSICQKEYSKRWSLKLHMFSHSDTNRFLCSDCGACFVRRDKYKKHMKSFHGKDFDASIQAGQYILPKELGREASHQNEEGIIVSCNQLK
ncbi:zinc finger protein 2 homolog [Sergentomyia squamirostris]